MKLSSAFTALLLPALCMGQTSKKVWLPSLISNNMMLQQSSKTNVWGKTAPGKTIAAFASWTANGKAVADASGNWKLSIPTPKAGGPYTLTISGNDTSIVIQNILIGEVWFCSGQSNMEMPLAGWLPKDTIMHSKFELSQPANQEIRLFNMQRSFSDNRAEDCSGKWEICNPTSLAPFSATAYFFGKKLNQTLRIPVGLINSSWGGTPIEAWISTEALKTNGDFNKDIADIEASKPLYNEYLVWLKKHRIIETNPGSENDKWRNLPLNDVECTSPVFDDTAWPKMKLPQRFEQQAEVGEFDGIIWYRKTIDVPETMVGKDLQLSLGPIDDMDETFFNGTKVGASDVPGMWQVDRLYTVPANLVKTGANTISIRVVDTQGGGGVWGRKEQMSIAVKDQPSVAIQLYGDWKYLPTAMLIDGKFYLYDIASREFFVKMRPKILNQNTPTSLFNAMVNPAVNYSIKGAIWYQGETNVGRADQYAKLLPLMIQNWRSEWGIENFPFYYVQIAPFNYDNVNSWESAALREAQALSMKTPHTGMVVTLDIGLINNVHPPYKKEVGDRLANWALAKDYGLKVPYCGPVYKSMMIEGNQLKLQFENIEGGLVAKNGELKEFEIAGKDGKYVPATAKIDNNSVILSSPLVTEPVAARYCWRNGAEASLFNSAGLPSTVFRTDKQ